MFKYNKNEIAISGYSNSGKTTLILKLMKQLSTDYSVGYIKHNAHYFEMDKEGKDTHEMWKSGANTVCINDKTHWSIQSRSPFEAVEQLGLFQRMDLVLLEGFKKTDITKIIIIDEKKQILRDMEQDLIKNYIAIVGSKSDIENLDYILPKFDRDDTTQICEFILTHFKCVGNNI